MEVYTDKHCANPSCKKRLTWRESTYKNSIPGLTGLVCYICYKGYKQDAQDKWNLAHPGEWTTREEFNKSLGVKNGNETTGNHQ